MRVLSGLIILIIIATTGGYILQKRREDRTRAAEFQAARKIATRCGLQPSRVRLLPEGRSDGPVVGLTGYLFDPATAEKDKRITCFERAMGRNKLIFADELYHGQFITPVPIADGGLQ